MSAKNKSLVQVSLTFLFFTGWHGNKAERNAPKLGNPRDYKLASNMATDYISANN